MKLAQIFSTVCLCFSSHPHAAARSERAGIKGLYQAQVFEKSKLKQKLEESQASIVKVCSLLIILFEHVGVH